MKPQKLMMLVCASIALQACASTPYDSRPVQELESPRAQPSAPAIEPCADPVAIPHRDLGAGDVQRLWARDRIALATCGARQISLVEFYRERDAGLAGEALTVSAP